VNLTAEDAEDAERQREGEGSRAKGRYGVAVSRPRQYVSWDEDRHGMRGVPR